VTRIGAAVSLHASPAAAGYEAALRAREQLGDAPVDLACVFATPEHRSAAAEVVAAVREILAPRHVLGCVAQGVVAGERELEEGPAVSVWAASLPGAAIAPFHLDAEAFDDDGDDEPALPPFDEAGIVLLLVDPFTFPADRLLRATDERYPGLPVVGGIALGGTGPGLQALVVDDDVHTEGAVGASIAGVPVQAVVSQGCAPLGRESVITSADENVVLELAGRPALERLRETVAGLSERERALASRGLLAGIVIDENKPAYARGDFLMRSILGADESSGAIAVGEQVRVGQTLRFHARDAASAADDLSETLADALGQTAAAPAGALLFTCNGRGAGLFGAPDHDAGAIAGALASHAVGGFFCGGEIGPVGGRSFVHGFTATLALFFEEEDQR
jgi:small ligand-binding sensory domain FIST